MSMAKNSPSSAANFHLPTTNSPASSPSLVDFSLSNLSPKVPAARGTTAPAVPSAGGLSPADVLQALKSRFFLVLLIAVPAMGLAAGAAWYLVKPSCTVTRTLLVASTQP